MQVEIWSDVVCPWCYIGKRRFERAVAEWGGDVEVTWKPFELDPSVPAEGADHHGYLRAKFGGPERTEQLLAHVARLAEVEGLDYRWHRVTRRPNTRRAHALTAFAGTKGTDVQDAVAEACFRAYFTEGRDLGSLDTLVGIAVAAGLDADEVRAELADEAALLAVANEERVGQSLGISGVPFFVIEGRYGISGAQDPETLVQILRQIEAELAA